MPIIACDCEVCQSDDLHDKRLRSSVFIEHNGVSMLIDAGPDFRQQMLRENIKDLDAILLTHEHKDHVGGLDDVRAFNYVLNRPMDIYAQERVLNHLKVEYSYVFSEKPYPGVPQMELHPIASSPFSVRGIKVQPIMVKHFKLPVTAFRIEDFSYVTDANYIEPDEIEKLKGSRVLVVNALRREEHISHFTLSQALSLVEAINPEIAYLTHISHQLGRYSDVQKELPSNVVLAYDGLKLDF